MDENKQVGQPEQVLKVDRVVDENRHTVEYRLAVVQKIAFSFDDPMANLIPDEYVAMMLSDGLREFVNSCRYEEVIRRNTKEVVQREDRPFPMVKTEYQVAVGQFEDEGD